MNLKLRSILGAGEMARERLTLRAGTGLDLGEYAVFQVPLLNEEVMTDVLHAYWFPYQPVDEGDLVVIYTKKGEARSKSLDNGKRAHFFYLGLARCIWDDPERAAVVLRAADWSFKGSGDLSG